MGVDYSYEDRCSIPVNNELNSLIETYVKKNSKRYNVDMEREGKRKKNKQQRRKYVSLRDAFVVNGTCKEVIGKLVEGIKKYGEEQGKESDDDEEEEEKDVNREERKKKLFRVDEWKNEEEEECKGKSCVNYKCNYDWGCSYKERNDNKYGRSVCNKGNGNKSWKVKRFDCRDYDMESSVKGFNDDENEDYDNEVKEEDNNNNKKFKYNNNKDNVSKKNNEKLFKKKTFDDDNNKKYEYNNIKNNDSNHNNVKPVKRNVNKKYNNNVDDEEEEEEEDNNNFNNNNNNNNNINHNNVMLLKKKEFNKYKYHNDEEEEQEEVEEESEDVNEEEENNYNYNNKNKNPQFNRFNQFDNSINNDNDSNNSNNNNINVNINDNYSNEVESNESNDDNDGNNDNEDDSNNDSRQFKIQYNPNNNNTYNEEEEDENENSDNNDYLFSPPTHLTPITNPTKPSSKIIPIKHNTHNHSPKPTSHSFISKQQLKPKPTAKANFHAIITNENPSIDDGIFQETLHYFYSKSNPSHPHTHNPTKRSCNLCQKSPNKSRPKWKMPKHN